MTWQPIDTAPRDGTRVLLWFSCFKDGQQVQFGSWLDSEERKYGKVTRITQCWIGEFYTMSLEKREPSYWMPLPASPE